MKVEYLIIATYLSFLIDFTFFSVKSEASTSALSSGGPLWKRSWLWMVFTLSLGYYLIPLFFALPLADLLSIPNWLMITAMFLILLGRFLTVYAAFLLKNATQTLVTNELFALSRNPITLGLHCALLGLLILTGRYWLLFAFPFYLLNFHFKIRLEEQYLSEKLGQAYSDYCSKTRRYL